MTKQRTISLIIMLYITACTIQSCVPWSINGAETSSVKISYRSWQGDYPLVLAEALGLYHKHGVNVDLVFMENYKESLKAFINREIDTTNTILVDTLIMSQNEDLQIVWIQDQTIASIVSRESIRSINELRGRSVGVDKGISPDEMMLEIFLSHHEIPMEEVKIKYVGSQNIFGSLDSPLDARILNGYSTSELLASGAIILDQSPVLSPDVMIFQRSWIKDNPEITQGLINAWGEAVLFWESNPGESIELITPYYENNDTKFKPNINENITLFSRQQNMEVFTPGHEHSIYDTAALNIHYLSKNVSFLVVPNLEALINWRFVGRTDKNTN